MEGGFLAFLLYLGLLGIVEAAIWFFTSDAWVRLTRRMRGIPCDKTEDGDEG